MRNSQHSCATVIPRGQEDIHGHYSRRAPRSTRRLIRRQRQAPAFLPSAAPTPSASKTITTTPPPPPPTGDWQQCHDGERWYIYTKDQGVPVACTGSFSIPVPKTMGATMLPGTSPVAPAPIIQPGYAEAENPYGEVENGNGNGVTTPPANGNGNGMFPNLAEIPLWQKAAGAYLIIRALRS